jgi:hypothetical protein
MWELYGQLGWKGEAEFRAKMTDMSRLVDQLQQKIDRLGRSSGGGAGGGADQPYWMKTFTQGVSGAPIPAANMPPPLPPPPAPVGTSSTPPTTRDSPPPSGGGGRRGGSGGEEEGDEGVQERGISGRLTEQLRTDPRLSSLRQAMGVVDPMAARMSKGIVPSTMIAGMSQAGRGVMDEAMRERAIRNQVGLMNDSRAATAEEIDITKRSIKVQKDLTDQSDKAGKKIGELGLRHAWIIRSATSGGPLGMLGGGLGAMAGGLVGNVGFGALIGNILGQSLTSGVERMHGLVGKADPGAALRFERTQADMEATFGKVLIPTMEKTTSVTRQFADVMASNEKGLGRFIDKAGEFILNTAPGLKYALWLLGEEANKPGIKGASQGAAISPLGGHVFSGPDELYRSVAAMTMMYGPRPAEQGTAEMKTGGVETPKRRPIENREQMGLPRLKNNGVVEPRLPGPGGEEGVMLMDSLWLGAFSGTRIT